MAQAKINRNTYIAISCLSHCKCLHGHWSIDYPFIGRVRELLIKYDKKSRLTLFVQFEISLFACGFQQLTPRTVSSIPFKCLSQGLRIWGAKSSTMDVMILPVL